MQSSHAAWAKLIGYELLTLDAGPAPADYVMDATITGGTSGKTAVIVAKRSSTVYLIKGRTGAFTDGEIISDGTNSRDCGPGYPQLTEFNAITDIADETNRLLPSSFLCKKLKAIRDKARSTGYISKREMKQLARAMEFLGERMWRDGV